MVSSASSSTNESVAIQRKDVVDGLRKQLELLQQKQRLSSNEAFDSNNDDNVSTSSNKRLADASPNDDAKRTKSSSVADKENVNNSNDTLASLPIQLSHQPSINQNDGYDVKVNETTIVSANPSVCPSASERCNQIRLLAMHGPIEFDGRDRTCLLQNRKSHNISVRTAKHVEKLYSLHGSRPTEGEFAVGAQWGLGKGAAVRYDESSGAVYVFLEVTSTWYASWQAAVKDVEDTTLDDIASAPIDAQRALLATVVREVGDGCITLSPSLPNNPSTARIFIGNGERCERYISITDDDGNISNHVLTRHAGNSFWNYKNPTGHSSMDVNGVTTEIHYQCVRLYSIDPFDGTSIELFNGKLTERFTDNHSLQNWVHQHVQKRGIDLQGLKLIQGLYNVLDPIKNIDENGYYPKGIGQESNLKIEKIQNIQFTENQFGPTDHPMTEQAMDAFANIVRAHAPEQISQATQEVMANNKKGGWQIAKAGNVQQYYTKLADGGLKCSFCESHVIKKWNGNQALAKAHLRGVGGDSTRPPGTVKNPLPCTAIPPAIRASIPGPDPSKQRLGKR